MGIVAGLMYLINIILFLILLPVALAISLIGIILWILLLPFRILCGFTAVIQLMADIVTYVISAPVIFFDRIMGANRYW